MRPYMTEERAITKKSCPLRTWPDGESRPCMGSNCMFWGWGDPTPDMDDQKGRCEAPGGAA